MATDESSGDILTRIRSAVTSIASEVTRRSSDPDGSSVVDAATRSLASTLERWGRNPSLSRLLGSLRQDVLTGPGERVHLVARPGVHGRHGGTARFIVGDAPAVEVPMTPGEDVHAVVSAPGPGLHPLRVEVRGPDREPPFGLAGERVLQVVDGRPVALVHAELFFPSGPDEDIVGALRALSRESFELAYFDVHEDNRYAEIYAEVERLGLPRAAILTLAAEDHELAALGVDFMPMFVSSAIGRLRASGVPVTTILSGAYEASAQTRARGIRVLSPRDALARARSGAADAEAKQAARLLRDKSVAAPLDWRLDQTTDSRRIAGNTFHAEFDNARARGRLFEAIEQASGTIHIQLYIVRASAFTDELIVRLIRRARAGVTVRFMVDALYSEEQLLGRLNESIRSLREESNVEVLAVDPIDSRTQLTVSRLKKRDHRKVVVVDGRRAFVSGRNASDEYYFGFDEVPVHDNSRHERIPWLDAHVEISGPLVRAVQEAFIDTWHEHGGAPVHETPSVLPKLEEVGPAIGRLVVHRGFADTNGLAMYEALLDDAQSHAYIVNDFPFVAAIERAIRRMLDRGVRVRILTGSASARRSDGTFFVAPLHRTLFEYMVKAKLEPLVAAGAETYEFMPPPSPLIVARGGRIYPYVHAKVVSIDGRVTTIGSANLDATASYWETEANVVVQDVDFAKQVEQALGRLTDASTRIDLDSEAWKRERAHRAVVGTLWPGTLYS